MGERAPSATGVPSLVIVLKKEARQSAREALTVFCQVWVGRCVWFLSAVLRCFPAMLLGGLFEEGVGDSPGVSLVA